MRRLRPLPVPTWAAPLKPLEYQQFVGVLREVLADLAEPHALDDDTGTVRFEATNLAVDLREAVGRCATERDADRARWHALVEDALREALVDPDDLDAVLADPQRIRAGVKVRLYPTAEIDQGAATVLHRPGPPGTAQVLVLDLPSTVVALPADRAGDDEAIEELWDLAWEATATGEPPEIDVTEITEGVPVLVLQNPGMFGASATLWLERWFDPTPEGALVALPTRHLVLVHPVRDTGAVAALGPLASEGQRLHDEGPDALAPGVAWWRPGGAWVALESWTDENGLNLRIPDELGAVLAALPQGAPGTPPPPEMPEQPGS